jgi:hypothetical protein
MPQSGRIEPRGKLGHYPRPATLWSPGTGVGRGKTGRHTACPCYGFNFPRNSAIRPMPRFNCRIEVA